MSIIHSPVATPSNLPFATTSNAQKRNYIMYYILCVLINIFSIGIAIAILVQILKIKYNIDILMHIDKTIFS